MAAVLLLLFLIALVVLFVAVLVMAVGATLASVGAGLLLRDAACGKCEPDPFGVALLAGGAAAFLAPVLMGVALYLAG